LIFLHLEIMNMKTHKKALLLLAALLSLGISASAALTDAQTASVKKAFNKVPALELPAKAARMVTQASASVKEDMAVEVVRTIIAKNPASAVAVVSAISAACPEVAPAVAAAASSMLKEQAVMIVAAAEKAAPKFSSKIYAAVSTAVPSAQAKLQARSTSRAAASPVASGTITVVSGPIAGLAYSPAFAPTEAPAPTLGWDNVNRYQGH
jgi:hypothetical protein